MCNTETMVVSRSRTINPINSNFGWNCPERVFPELQREAYYPEKVLAKYFMIDRSF